MDAYARQRLSKIAKVIPVALTPQTQQARVGDLGAMWSPRLACGMHMVLLMTDGYGCVLSHGCS